MKQITVIMLSVTKRPSSSRLKVRCQKSGCKLQTLNCCRCSAFCRFIDTVEVGRFVDDVSGGGSDDERCDVDDEYTGEFNKDEEDDNDGDEPSADLNGSANRSLALL